MRRQAEHAGLHLSVRELLDQLAGIQETVLIYHDGGKGRPRVQRMLTDMTPTQQRLADLFDIHQHAADPLTRGNPASWVIHHPTPNRAPPAKPEPQSTKAELPLEPHPVRVPHFTRETPTSLSRNKNPPLTSTKAPTKTRGAPH